MFTSTDFISSSATIVGSVAEPARGDSHRPHPLRVSEPGNVGQATRFIFPLPVPQKNKVVVPARQAYRMTSK